MTLLFDLIGLIGLIAPRRRKTQEDVAGRAAEVVVQVLYDIGVDRFLDGTMLLERRFRICFHAVPPPRAEACLARVPVRELPEARAFHAAVCAAGFDAALDRHVPALVEGLMRALLARSPALCALPPARGG
ncbi:MAG: hypothetical protein ACRYGO_18650 [Janthinobacterium lividum]